MDTKCFYLIDTEQDEKLLQSDSGGIETGNTA